MVRTRLLEAWWAGHAAWLLRRSGARHDDVLDRLRGGVLDVGEGLVAVRLGAAPAVALAQLDRLAWIAGVARACGALSEPDAARLDAAVAAARALLR